MSAIPLTDAPAFHSAAVRTRILLALLALGLLAVVLAAVLVARNPHTRTTVTLPSNADAIVVLDLSASISSDTYSRIGATLESLSRGDGHYGLVIFSDQAYEALPPGTPAAALKPLVRYFTLPPQTTPGFAPTFPPNPWSDVFSAGTRISTGLLLARNIALDDKLKRPALILISDLDDDPNDLTRLQFVAAALQRDKMPLHIVALNPTPDNASRFQKLVGRVPTTGASLHAGSGRTSDRTPFPWTLVALALAAAVLLAVAELWGPLLDVRDEP
jgi:hypothetical protein